MASAQQDFGYMSQFFNLQVMLTICKYEFYLIEAMFTVT